MTTATASGKSLCYTLPFLHTYLAAPDDTKVSKIVASIHAIHTHTHTHTHTQALFIFPTKALAQDQLASLRSLAQAVCSPSSSSDSSSSASTGEKQPQRNTTIMQSCILCVALPV